MTALLLVLMFVLSIFMIVQFALRETITGQETELQSLSLEVADLADALGLERRRGAELVQALTAERARGTELVSQIGNLESQVASQLGLIQVLTGERDAAQEQITEFEAQVAGLLNRNAILDDRNNTLMATLTSTEERLASAETLIENQSEELATVEANLAAREEAIAAAEARMAALETARDQEITAREAAELALLQARQEINSETETARLAAAKADALEALIADLEAEAAARDAELAQLQADTSAQETALANLRAEAGQADELAEALSEAEQQRIAEAAAAEALRRRLQESQTELTAMTLALEEQRRKAEETLTLLAAAEAARDDLTAEQTDNLDELTRQQVLLAQANQLLADEKAVSAEAQREVELLNQQILALRQQLNSLQGILDEAEDRDREAQVQIDALGSKLNAALAQVAAEQRRRAELEEAERKRLEAEAAALKDEARDLASYRSEFFGRLRKLLSDREGVKIVGDRFVFSSEVLFAPGSAELGAGGRAQISNVAGVIREIADEIPDEIDWILRVDGHTDKVQLGAGSRFADNWELSQARALSVVKYLIEEEGIPADRLAATGFGEFQPVAFGDDPASLAQNRRIELKLTEK